MIRRARRAIACGSPAPCFIPRRPTHDRAAHGFTLIELLVVVSIIALLIGMLLPALGEARRSARLVQDVANLGEHAKGAGAYVIEHKGRMPNTRADAAAGSGIGPRTTPKQFYCYKAFNEINNGIALGGLGVSHGHLWKWYFPVFGDYIYDADGFDLFSDVFVSPGAGWIKGGWSFMKRDSRSRSALEYFSTGRFKVPFASTDDLRHPALVQSTGFDDKDLTWSLAGSYRYTLAAIMGKSHINIAGFARSDFFEGVSTSPFGSGAKSSPWSGGGAIPSWTPWRVFVQQSAFVHPSKKVLFYDTWASNSPADFYISPRAETAIVMVDGAARVSRPHHEMQGYRETVRRHALGDPVGTQQEYRVNRLWGVAGFDSDGRHWAPAWFAMTIRGPRGRDF